MNLGQAWGLASAGAGPGRWRRIAACQSDGGGSGTANCKRNHGPSKGGLTAWRPLISVSYAERRARLSGIPT
jgi:hypothetical protein